MLRCGVRCWLSVLLAVARYGAGFFEDDLGDFSEFVVAWFG